MCVRIVPTYRRTRAMGPHSFTLSEFKREKTESDRY